jgi:hypothetical protein
MKKKDIMKQKLTSRWSLKQPLYLEKNDKRYKAHAKELKENGFSHAETWGLNSVIAEFILPRLKRFKEVTNGYPMGLIEDQWNDILDKMIFAFDWVLTYEDKNLSDEEIKDGFKKFDEGMELFSENFMDLWW